MKRFLVLTLLLLGVGAAPACSAFGLTSVGVGAFGGLSVPVLQDVTASSFSPSDAFGKTGSQFGLRVPVVAIPLFTLEPFWSKSSYADRTETLGGISYTRDGYSGSAYGLNAILGRVDGSSVSFYPFVGIGHYKLTRTGSDDISDVGYDFGLGLGVQAVQKVSVQIRGEFAMVKTGDTSRKFTGATLGLNYSLLP